MSSWAQTNTACPSCGSHQVRIFYETPPAPVNTVLLLSTREQALSFPTGDVRLGFCSACGFIYNSAFDRRLVEYSSRCEETQGFSPYFRQWHENLARRLIERYSLRGKKIVEIGCGKGEFLALLCELGDNRGLGFDPAYIPERTSAESARRIEFVADFYSEKNSEVGGDFLCCKMTLEHISDTAAFLRMVRSSLRNATHQYIFFQVPDVLRILKEQAFWDVYYEHCSYFSTGSLARLFRRCGFEILDVATEYDGQYVTIEARAAQGPQSPLPAEDDLQELHRLVDNFAARVPQRIAQWRKRLEGNRTRGLRTVVWGAGSKGATFLSTINVPGAVPYVVDINPHMAGHYLAKTGIPIVQPSFLSDYRPDAVVVMNPVYRAEITADLNKMGLRPEVLCA